MDFDADRPRRFCRGCKCTKDLNEKNFRKVSDGTEFSVSCLKCLSRKKKNTNSAKENRSASNHSEHTETVPSIPNTDFVGTSILGLDQFLDAISRSEVETFASYVQIASIKHGDKRACADTLAKLVWERMDYRFVYGYKL